MRTATGYVWLAMASGLAWITNAAPAAAQVVARVSTDATGTQVGGASRQPSVSADGRLVAFSSTAATLVAGDTNASADVFVKDRQTGAVTRVSVQTGGAQAAVGDSVAPDISPDGRYVTFVSAAFLTPDDVDANTCPGATVTGPSCPDVFRHDRTTGETIRISVASNGTQGNGASGAPRISGDGRYVVFESAATTLVAGDTNARRDIFLRDVQTSTTTRVSVATGGAQSDRDATAPSISDDGARVAFLSDANTLDGRPDPMPCDAAILPCTRVFVHAVAAGTTARAPFSVFQSLTGIVTQAFQVRHGGISADGLAVAVAAYGLLTTQSGQHSYEGFGTLLLVPGAPPIAEVVSGAEPVRAPAVLSLGIDATGRFRAHCNGASTFGVGYFDQHTWFTAVTGVSGLPDCDGLVMSGDSLTVAFASSGAALVSGDTNGASDVFVLDLDVDGDGMAVPWEDYFRFSDTNAADGSSDADFDGITNRQEFVAGTHPRGLFKYYLAEGADNDFFTIAIDVFRPKTPTNEVTDIIAQFLGQNGRRTTSPILHLYSGPTAGGTWRFADGVQGLNPFPRPDQSFSTLVESERRLAVERTMTWGGGIGAGYGSHAERAVSGPAANWYFAEGATHGAFDLFYLLQNPGATTATATITYLLPAPRPPIVRSYTLLPNSRRTIYVDAEPGLEATDVSARIAADRGIFAERAMYMTSGGQPFTGGTASAGITAPALQWFIAEGATGAFFDLFVLIGNPSPSVAQVTVTYLLPDGTTVERQHTVAAQSRRTITVKAEDPRLEATVMSATISSTNGTPIVVERAMWWPSPFWYEGTVTAASTTSATRWALAGGFVDPRPDTETYLLVANPGTVAANVTFDIGAACLATVAVPARGRYTAGIKSLCPSYTGTSRVSGTVTSDGPPIVVERSTYWSTPDQFWAAGASTLLTPIP